MTPHRYRSFTEQNLPDNVTDRMIDEAFGREPEEDGDEAEFEYERRCRRGDEDRDRERDERWIE